MRIVIDMQGAQTESRYRGIGRYTLSFARAVVRNRGEHEIFLALSGLFPDTIEPIRAAFDGLIPQDHIRVWHALGPVNERKAGNEARREVAELIREAFLASLQPDVIHISSLFEGYVDDAVTSVGRFDKRTCITSSLYDLIPLLNPGHYLDQNCFYKRFYERKMRFLGNIDRHLAISDATRKEALITLELDESDVVNVSTATEMNCEDRLLSAEAKPEPSAKFGITKQFIFYSGGADNRKNLPRLIEAYAALPLNLRGHCQLVLAGKIPESTATEFQRLAKTAGLRSEDLVLTGYVNDDELKELYRSCRLYIFPSWHEGFGLPLLEAMACGAPVICSNNSSLPEVVGFERALFDPFDTSSITAKMLQAMTDDVFRAELVEHGKKQVKKFSWDETAKRAITAWEELSIEPNRNYPDVSTNSSRLYQCISHHLDNNNEAELFALATQLSLNEMCGVERQLFLDISELSQRDSATGVQRVVRGYLRWLLKSPPKGFRVEPVYATQIEGYRYARRFTQRFLGQGESMASDDPVRWQRGDVFFGLDMQHHVQLAHESFYRQIRLDGVTVKFMVYDLLPIQLPDLFKDSDAGVLHSRWLSLILETDGAICISKATADAFEEWWTNQGASPSGNFQNSWVHIGADIDGSRPSQGMPENADEVLETIESRITFLCVATLEPRKGQAQILGALEELWAEGIDVNIILVGQKGWQTERLVKLIQNHVENSKRLFWLEGISDEFLEKVYVASTCLIAASINEGFGLPLIEAARYKLPLIARDCPVFREVAGNNAHFFQGLDPGELASSIKEWLELYRFGRQPSSSALRYSTWERSTDALKKALIDRNYPRKQLLVDISELVQRDAKTGIQRVVRNVLREWLEKPPEGWRVEPVYALVDQDYRYARKFTANFLGLPNVNISDDPIDYAPGDVFFGLDLQPQVQVAHRKFYQSLRRHGVEVKFLVYDLLSLSFPQYFPEGSSEGHAAWLDVVSENNGAVCISKATSEEFNSWMQKNRSSHAARFKNHWFHLGANGIEVSSRKELPDDAERTLSYLSGGVTFLMVGTLEPRKGHAQVLDAFETLWSEGRKVNLVIVGKQGWLVSELIKRLCSHPELNAQLFWLENISDEYLKRVYGVSTCLIAASYGEGFGLPLIEAAQHHLPVIARDIPVFSEVAGSHAFYFTSRDPGGLAKMIVTWIVLFKKNQHPRTDSLKWLTWRESAKNLFKQINQ